MKQELGKTLSEMSLEELWHLFPITLEQHNSEWAEWYKDEENRLRGILGDRVSRTDHIGSTAVKGLIAKPIVDILLQRAPDTELSEIMNLLVADGWLVMAENSDFGEVDLNKGYTPQGFAQRVFHLHIRKEGNWDELRFRDYLVDNPEAASQYAELKKQLAVAFRHNRDAYTAAKTAFVKASLAQD